MVLPTIYLENFFSHLPMGVTPNENLKIPLFRKCTSEALFFLKKISTIRKCISENTSWGVCSEMNFRKHLMGGVFGDELPKTPLFRFLGVSEMHFQIMQKQRFFFMFFLTISYF